MYGTSQAYRCQPCTSCGSCYGSKNSSSGYSKLESIAGSYQGNIFANESAGYGSEMKIVPQDYAKIPVQKFHLPSSASAGKGGYSLNYNQTDLGFLYKKSKAWEESLDQLLGSRLQENYSFIPDNFLKPNRRRRRFVGKAEEIEDYVQEAFRELMGMEFPDDITIRICEEKEFRKIAPNPGVVGLSLNRRREGLVSDVLILNDELDKVLLTVGHEIGHVLNETLPDQRDEEAKAFAFSFAWMEKIKEKDIAGLGGSIIFDNPARNGLHDVAFNFVAKLMEHGKKAMEIFTGLAGRNISFDYA